MIIETRDKTKNPVIRILDDKKEMIKGYNIPVGAHVMVNKGQNFSQEISWLRFLVLQVNQVISPVVFLV